MDNGSRNYDVAGYRLPSVTTILGKTKDTSSLDSWIAKRKKRSRTNQEPISNTWYSYAQISGKLCVR